MNLNIKILKFDAIIPTKAHNADAGYDLYACLEEPIKIFPNENYLIPTGIAIQIPEHHFGAIYPRSGLAHKSHLRLSNCVGVIDCGYNNEIFVSLYNDSYTEVKIINPGDRIAQLIIHKCENDIDFNIVDSFEKTERNMGGFGSSGVSLTDECESCKLN